MTMENTGEQSRIPVLEIFGPTVQGEGIVIGQKTMFVRTAGCDYACVWCDSAFTWDGSAKQDIRMLTPAEVMTELLALGADGCSHVTISGGNPALLRQLDGLIDALHAHGMAVALETQGSRWQDWFRSIDQLTLSPKPPSSGMVTDWEVLDDILGKLAGQQGSKQVFSLKVVVFDENDLHYAVKVHARYPGVPFFVQAGNAEVTEPNAEQLLPRLVRRYEWLVAQVMASSALKDVRVLPQLHTWVWGNKRGV